MLWRWILKEGQKCYKTNTCLFKNSNIIEMRNFNSQGQSLLIIHGDSKYWWVQSLKVSPVFSCHGETLIIISSPFDYRSMVSVFYLEGIYLTRHLLYSYLCFYSGGLVVDWLFLKVTVQVTVSVLCSTVYPVLGTVSGTW